MKNLSRRIFLQGFTGAVMASASGLAFLTGCNAASVFAAIEAWIPAGKQAFAGIVTLLGPFLPAGTAAIVALVNSSLDAVLAAVQEYMNAPAANKATAIEKIRLALQAVTDNISKFLAGLSLQGNPIITVVIGLAQIILSTIAGFIGQLPVPAGVTATPPKLTFTVSGVSAPIVPKARTLKSFKAAFNAMAEANGHPEIDIK